MFYECTYCHTVSSHHGEFLLQGEMVSFLLSISSEAPSPGQLRLLQQPACKVNTQLTRNTNTPPTESRQIFISGFPNRVIKLYGSVKVESFCLTINPRIQL